MVEINILVIIIGIGAFIGSILNISLGIIFLKKNRESAISKAFVTFFICVAVSLLEMSSYYILPMGFTGMKLLYSTLYLVSMIGVISFVTGISKLLFPTNKPFKSLIFPVMIVITVITFLLTFTDVTHSPETINPIYTPLFILCFILTFEIPLGYIMYHLTKKRDWISEERQKWFKNLRYFFILSACYPLLESLSGLANEFRILDLGNGIFIFTSLLLLHSLPNYKDWYLDELKTLTMIKQLKENYPGPIDELWEKMDRWEMKFNEKNKQLTIPEFKGYLKEIEDALEIKLK